MIKLDVEVKTLSISLQKQVWTSLTYFPKWKPHTSISPIINETSNIYIKLSKFWSTLYSNIILAWSLSTVLVYQTCICYLLSNFFLKLKVSASPRWLKLFTNSTGTFLIVKPFVTNLDIPTAAINVQIN